MSAGQDPNGYDGESEPDALAQSAPHALPAATKPNDQQVTDKETKGEAGRVLNRERSHSDLTPPRGVNNNNDNDDNSTGNSTKSDNTRVSGRSLGKSSGALSLLDRGFRPEIEFSEISFGPVVGSGQFGSVRMAHVRGQKVAVKEILWKNTALNGGSGGSGSGSGTGNKPSSQSEMRTDGASGDGDRGGGELERQNPALADFRKEVAALSRLSHPHIVTYMGTCTEGDHLMIVQDFLPYSLESFISEPVKASSQHGRGGSGKRAASSGYNDSDRAAAALSGKLRTKPTLEKLRMLAGVARGMTWLHSNKPPVLHLDLKPANILMDENGSCRVADFGQAKIQKAGPVDDSGYDDDTQLSGDDPDGESSTFGSPLYTAPEVFAGAEPSTKMDVYSFAITAWELLSGSRAYSDVKGLFALMRAVEEGRRPPWDERTRDVSASVRQLIEACWDSEPENRPSFAEIVPRLDDALFESTVPNSEARRFWRECFQTLFGPASACLYVVAESASWDDFKERVLLTFFQSASETMASVQIATCMALMEKILRELGGSSDASWTVTATAWGQFCEFFGPVLPQRHSVVLSNLLAICRHKYFFGAISAEDAARKCLKPGEFLIRFSGRTYGAFVLTRAVKADAKQHKGGIQYVHTTITQSDGKFVFAKTGQSAKSLVDLVTIVKKSEHLTKPPKGSDFAALVAASEMKGASKLPEQVPDDKKCYDDVVIQY